MSQTMSSVKKLTDEQQAIIQSTGNIKINAVAGSGKTSTLIEYAATRPPGSAILYLAFNKSVKMEAQRKFAARGLHNIRVETAHSLAYGHIVRKYGYTLNSKGYQTHELVELLGLEGHGEKLTEYIIANHIGKFITYFCNSDKQKVQELYYADTIADPQARAFVKSFYTYIEKGARTLLGKMNKGEIPIIHDFYLKKFQLSNPVLPYDYILFDEGQDASAAMLSIFLDQKAVKVIVGDTHQQIYGWRHAVNSLEKTDFTTFHLSTSFRFQQPLADLAGEVLKWKKHFSAYKPVTITGRGACNEERSQATIARSNLGLLLQAIRYINDHPKTKQLYFEGNIHSYTYADDGASLYDILHLFNHRRHLIRDKLIQSMKNLTELGDYIEKTEDAQLSMMLEIVLEYGNEIPGILKRLKELQTNDSNREKAEMIFSTVHRAKGMEYDIVHLVDDFTRETELEKIKETKKEKAPDIPKLAEEVNLLYVAITRTKNILHIPQVLMPKNAEASPFIRISKVAMEDVPTGVSPIGKPNANAIKQIKEKAYASAQKRKLPRDVSKPWTAELDMELKQLYESDNPVRAIAKHFGRTSGGIISRLKKLNCIND